MADREIQGAAMTVVGLFELSQAAIDRVIMATEQAKLIEQNRWNYD